MFRSILGVRHRTFLAAIAFALPSCPRGADPRPGGVLAVRGAVERPLELSADSLRSLPSLRIDDVAIVAQKEADAEERLLGVFDYRGVLLRDILRHAGMVHKRKYEPGVFIRVRDGRGAEAVFSFGEIFYSSIGRSALLALQRDGDALPFPEGLGELVVATDIRALRQLAGVREIVVERVPIELQAYRDRAAGVERPPSTRFLLRNVRAEKEVEIRLEDLRALPSVSVESAILIGDCEGFRGIHAFEGVPLARLIERHDLLDRPLRPAGYVVVASADGFCATFSLGELFASRLANNVLIAYRKDGALLGPEEGFAMSVVAEDGIGGRSVRRIDRIEVF